MKMLMILLVIFPLDTMGFAIDKINPYKSFPDSSKTKFMKYSVNSSNVLLLLSAGALITERNRTDEKRLAAGIAVAPLYLSTMSLYIRFDQYKKDLNKQDNWKELSHEEESKMKRNFYYSLALNAGVGIYHASLSDNNLNKVLFYALPASSLILSIVNETFKFKNINLSLSPNINGNDIDGFLAGLNTSF